MPAQTNQSGNEYELNLPDHPPGAVQKHFSSTSGQCPNCNRDLKPTVVLCMNCGYNLAEGKVITTKLVMENEVAATADANTLPPGRPLAAMGTPSAVAVAVQQRQDDIGTNPKIDLWLPLGLIAMGLVVTFIQKLYFSDSTGEGIIIAIITAAVEIMLTIPFLLVGTIAAAKLLDLSFGPLGPALFKMAAIILGPSAIGTITTFAIGNFMGFFVGSMVAFIVYWTLVSMLFNLDGADAFYVIIIIWIVRYVSTHVLGMLSLAALF